MIDYTNPIAESNHFIILNTYNKDWQVCETYQSEADLEDEFHLVPTLQRGNAYGA